MTEKQEKGTRKHYIDNLRNFTILLLFPVHTFMIWNDFGSRFYIWQGENKVLSTLIVLVNPWFMPLLFVLAGMSARYALEKRTCKEFAAQRVWKLFIPFAGCFSCRSNRCMQENFLVVTREAFRITGNIFLCISQISAVMTGHSPRGICGLSCFCY